MISQPGSNLIKGALVDPTGSVLARIQTPSNQIPGESRRAFCRESHRKVFDPKLDLPQQQIRSLEGATLASQDAKEMLKEIWGN